MSKKAHEDTKMNSCGFGEGLQDYVNFGQDVKECVHQCFCVCVYMSVCVLQFETPQSIYGQTEFQIIHSDKNNALKENPFTLSPPF